MKLLHFLAQAEEAVRKAEREAQKRKEAAEREAARRVIYRFIVAKSY
jgi:hypothetical protein